MTASDTRLGARAMAIVHDLAVYSDERGRLTRLYLSKAHRAAAEATRELMQAAGMAATVDAVGNVVGRYPSATPDAPALLVGSHLDSVVDAGRYDGPFGIAAGIVLVEEVARRGAKLPFALEVVAFGDEENVRFPTNLSTSYALAGCYDPAWLDGSDAAGVSLRDALRAFGGDPDGIPALARHPGDVIGYLELHIEQGPLLEAEDLAVGVVSAINGISRARVRITGEAGHAGTVPMAMRRDALAGAAEMVAAAERLAAGRPDTVATVGALQIRPGAVNVIPAAVELTLDARAPQDDVRHALGAEIMRDWEASAARRGLRLEIEPFMDSPATAMDPKLMGALEAATAALGIPARGLASGAGHDAVAMARLCPAAMLFVRCKGGVSHNPAESITEADADIAIRVLVETVARLAAG